MGLREKLAELLKAEEEESKPANIEDELLKKMTEMMDAKLEEAKKSSEESSESKEGQENKQEESKEFDEEKLLEKFSSMMDEKIKSVIPKNGTPPAGSEKKSYTKHEVSELMNDYGKNKELITKILKDDPSLME